MFNNVQITPPLTVLTGAAASLLLLHFGTVVVSCGSSRLYAHRLRLELPRRLTVIVAFIERLLFFRLWITSQLDMHILNISSSLPSLTPEPFRRCCSPDQSESEVERLVVVSVVVFVFSLMFFMDSSVHEDTSHSYMRLVRNRGSIRLPG
ncbi:hypothetical protein AcW1_009299 [Taiwanofungus camphoratus]|nr:hypothetical protein AcW1_009299 [Antrodia cinnamomea]